jgi:lysozyme family protein
MGYVLNDEGGFAERANEPGGYCNMGVSMTAFIEWRHGKGMPTPTPEDLKALTREEATELYWEKYAMPSGFADHPPGVDYVMFNTAIMQGVGGAHVLYVAAGRGWKPDLGDTMGVIAMIARILLFQAAAKMHDPNCGPHIDPKTGKPQHGFGPGWADRLLRVQDRAAMMVT